MQGRGLCRPVLAAGISMRFGGPKQLAAMGGLPLARTRIASAGRVCVPPVIVLTGDGGERVAECLIGFEFRVVSTP